jgi:hypothetical protein
MEAALSLGTAPLDLSLQRRSAWAHQVAKMSRRLELRWSRDRSSPVDPDLESQRLEAGAARVAFADAMERLANSS